MAKFEVPAPNKYSLPPVVGYPKHDITKYRNPQYTMSPKLKPLGKPLGPGPCYHLERLTRVGKTSPPAYSIKSRAKPLKPFVGPGAGAYSPEKCPRMKDQRPPCYTIKSRKPPLTRFVTPGPDKYMLPTTLGCKVPDLYNRPCYTMRPKIKPLTKFETPGPKYSNVNTNLYKQKPPMYTIRPKVGLTKKETSPGPKYYPKLPICVQVNERGYSFGLKISKTSPYYTEEDKESACLD
ncbi:outer dense fiber protein 3-like protein 2 [Diorhabda sublineata]|uniref:outer dense fiber protein 3-like protein 2 n=1 Tax=Diorhabda sublineata TaxID=1163346 RepID=UPI0024E06357|nr:outer dense fiber protein 3-like protein 2 [Diorhabda sublineata]